jgi:hypothetical protein
VMHAPRAVHRKNCSSRLRRFFIWHRSRKSAMSGYASEKSYPAT